MRALLLCAVAALALCSCVTELPVSAQQETRAVRPVLVLDRALAAGDVDSIAVALAGDCLDNPVAVPIDHDRAAHTFSGTMDVPLACDLCTVTVMLYDTAGHKIGQGSAAFSSVTSSVTVPVISSTSALPSVDSLEASRGTCYFGDTITLHALVSDSFGGTVALLEWSIGGAAFVAASTPDTQIVMPASEQDVVCVLRVTDDDGNQVLDSVTIAVRDTVTYDTAYIAIHLSKTTAPAAVSVALLGLPSLRLREDVFIPELSAFLTTWGGDLYVVQQSVAPRLCRINQPFGDTITPLYDTPIAGSGTVVVAMAFAGPGKAYVALQGTSLVLVVDPADGTVTDSIDLSALGYHNPMTMDSILDPPGFSDMAVYNNRLFVGLGRRNGMGEGDTSCLAVICTQGDTLLDTVHLRWQCPVDLSPYQEKLYVASGGCTAFGSSSGGIEVLDMGSMEWLGTVLQQGALGGTVGKLTILGPSKGYAYTFQSIAGFVGEVVEFDPTTGSVYPKVGGMDKVGDYVYDGTYLYIGDAGDSTQVRVFNPTGNSPVGSPVRLSMSPVKLVHVSRN